MNRLLLIAAMLVSTSAATAADDAAVTELTKLSTRIADALVAGDAAAIDGIMVDDWVLIGPSGGVVTKEQSQKNLRDGTSKYTAMEKAEMKARVYGDAGVVTGRAHVKGTDARGDFESQVRYTEVFIKRMGRWQCVSSQVTLIPSESGAKP